MFKTKLVIFQFPPPQPSPLPTFLIQPGFTSNTNFKSCFSFPVVLGLSPNSDHLPLKVFVSLPISLSTYSFGPSLNRRPSPVSSVGLVASTNPSNTFSSFPLLICYGAATLGKPLILSLKFLVLWKKVQHLEGWIKNFSLLFTILPFTQSILISEILSSKSQVKPLFPDLLLPP